MSDQGDGNKNSFCTKKWSQTENTSQLFNYNTFQISPGVIIKLFLENYFRRPKIYR